MHDNASPAFKQTRLRRLIDSCTAKRDDWIAAQAQLVPAGSLVLDVGAGSCPYRSLFAHCNYRAQDFLKLKPNDLRGVCGYGAIDIIADAIQLPVREATVDFVLCTEVLEHVPNPIQVVAECGRVLKPGGKIILTAPLGSGLHQQPYHFYGGFTPYWYQKFLTQAGFTAISAIPNGGFFCLHAQETLRWARVAAPWRLAGSWLVRLLWAPFWVLIGGGLAGGAVVSRLLDRFDKERQFTVGYHVTAVRATPPPAAAGLRNQNSPQA